MAKKSEKKELLGYGYKASKNCEVFFFTGSPKGLIVEIETFKGKSSVVLTEETFKALQEAYLEFKREAKNLESNPS